MNDKQGLHSPTSSQQAVYRGSWLHISRRWSASCFVYTRYSFSLPSRTHSYLFLEQSFFICHPILDKNKGFSLRDKKLKFRIPTQAFCWLCTSLSQVVHVTKIFRISHFPAQPIITHQLQRGAGNSSLPVNDTVTHKQQEHVGISKYFFEEKKNSLELSSRCRVCRGNLAEFLRELVFFDLALVRNRGQIWLWNFTNEMFTGSCLQI